MTQEELEFAKLFKECTNKSISSIKTCYHPECEEKSINSHLLQKNGILSSIAIDSHLWHMEIDNFKNPYFSFKRSGLNKVYSFNCFCNKHDSELFKKIETSVIDFEDYESCLLFTLRSVYNEIWRKEVNLQKYHCMSLKKPELNTNPIFTGTVQQETLGLSDLRITEKEIWNDLKNNTESFVFENRKISRIELCLTAFYNYETTLELNQHILTHGKDMESVSSIFVNIFPYQNISRLLMGYMKKDEKKVKGYFYTFFKESEKRLQRKLTNLMVFQCETWVVSDQIYNQKIKGIEDLFAHAMKFSCNNPNERQTFDINIFNDNFKDKFLSWCNQNVG